MARDNRHVASGIAAVIDSAHIATTSDVWVDTADLPEALRQLRKLTGDPLKKGSVYPDDRAGRDSRVCIRLE